MSGLDEVALSDAKLAAWLARKANPQPLVRSLSALEGFVTAVVAGPAFADPQYWICPAMGFRWDVLTKGSRTSFAVFASVARIHNRVSEVLADNPQGFAPRFDAKPGGGVDPRPWCQGFYAAMHLNLEGWQPLLNLDDINHGLLLPILLYCVEEDGSPVLGPPRPGPETAHFIEHEGHKDIAQVVPAIREFFQTRRYRNAQ